MFTTPYRTRATTSTSQRAQLDVLLKVTAPHERVFLAGIGVSVLVFLCWMAFGSVTRTFSVDGILIESGPRYPIVSTSDGRLEAYLVVPGARIEAGGPIARQTVPELEKRAAILHELLDSVAAEIGEAGGDALVSLRASVRKSLLQLEAERIAKGIIVSHRSGVVMTLLRYPGEELAVGDKIAWIRAVSEHPRRVVAQVPDGMARQIRSDMPVTVTVALPDEPPRQFKARVADTAVQTWPDWLTSRVSPDPDGSLQRVDFLFDNDAVPAVSDGTPVQVHIRLAPHSPTTLLFRSSL